MRYGKLVAPLVVLLSALMLGIVVFSVAAQSADEIEEARKAIADALRQDVTAVITQAPDTVENENIYYPEYKESSTAERLGNIYSNYNKANAKILKQSFADYLTNSYSFQGESSSHKAFADIIGVYVDKLFDGIEEQNQSASTEEAIQQFILSESDAFDCLYEYVYNIIQSGKDYKPVSEDLIRMIDCVADSKCALSTLRLISEDSDTVKAFSDAFLKVGEDIRKTIDSTFSEYFKTADEPAREVILMFAKITNGVTVEL